MAVDWPTQRRKAAHKQPNRRTIADLAKEQLDREKASGVRI